MFEVQNWVFELTVKLKKRFGSGLCFVGYQGSYRRGEANKNSDIDVVVIFEYIDINILVDYKKVIETMPFAEKACGFICGKEELEKWSGYELFQLYNDTVSVYGKLEDFIPEISQKDATTAAKTGAENVYHLACHSFLYDKDRKTSLKQLYKSIVFTIQAKYFSETKEYILTKDELFKKVTGIEKELLEISMKKDDIETFSVKEIENSYSVLIDFCADIIRRF